MNLEPMHSGHNRQNRNAGGENEDLLIATAMTAASALFLASYLPVPLVAITLSQILMLSSAASALLAFVLRQQVFSTRLTHWDQSAMLLFLGLLASQFVDPDALAAALDAAGVETNMAGMASQM